MDKRRLNASERRASSAAIDKERSYAEQRALDANRQLDSRFSTGLVNLLPNPNKLQNRVWPRTGTRHRAGRISADERAFGPLLFHLARYDASGTGTKSSSCLCIG
jgi:hypothetical protein